MEKENKKKLNDEELEQATGGVSIDNLKKANTTTNPKVKEVVFNGITINPAVATIIALNNDLTQK